MAPTVTVVIMVFIILIIMYFVVSWSAAKYIFPLEPELIMSTPTYGRTETTRKSKLLRYLCQMGHKQKWT